MIKPLPFVCAFLLLAAGTATADSPAKPTDLTTSTGKTYKQARVFRVEPDGITYMFAGGMVKVPFAELPEAVRKEHGYNPKAAASFAEADDAVQARAFAAAQEQTNREANQRLQTLVGSNTDLAADAARRKSEEEKAQQIHSAVAHSITISAKVVQVLDTGVLLRYRMKLDNFHWAAKEEEEMIYVAGLQDQAVDGTPWSGTVYPYGRYQYTTVAGAGATLMGFATTPSAAVTLSKQ